MPSLVIVVCYLWFADSNNPQTSLGSMILWYTTSSPVWIPWFLWATSLSPALPFSALVPCPDLCFRAQASSHLAANVAGCSWITVELLLTGITLHQRELTWPRLYLFPRVLHPMTDWCRGTKIQDFFFFFFCLSQQHLWMAIPTLLPRWDKLRILLYYKRFAFQLLPLLYSPYFIATTENTCTHLYLRVCLAEKET